MSFDWQDTVGKLGALGTIVSSFVGGAMTYIVNSPDGPAQALTTIVAAAANAPFSWKGALVMGVAATAAKVLKNAPPSEPTTKP